jgi:hypothetical protein
LECLVIIVASAAFGTYLNGNKHFHFIPTLICFIFGAFILGYIISNFAEIKNG